jgi:hypothetical protein
MPKGRGVKIIDGIKAPFDGTAVLGLPRPPGPPGTGYAERYDYALQAMKDIPYNQWRDYDPEDTVRFHALRLHEAGLIKAGPQKIIAQGTDWRFIKS